MNPIRFNFYNFIITIGIIHGFIFCIILFFNIKLKSKTNKFLSFTILSLCLSNLQYLLYDLKIIGDFYAEYLFVPFEFLTLPMFYLFVKSYLDVIFVRREVVLLSIPFFATNFVQLLTHLFNITDNIKNSLNLTLEYVAFSFSFILIVLIFKIIFRYEK